MPIARSTVAGAATGAVLLVAAVGFGVGLPKVIDDPAAATTTLPTLPEKLDDRFVALQSITAEQAGLTSAEQTAQFKTFVASTIASEKQANKSLAKEYGAARARSYIDLPEPGSTQQSTPAQLAVTIVPGPAGLLNPSGPFSVDQSGAHYQLQDVQGKRCAVIWKEAADPTTGMPTGQPPTAADYNVQCRTESKGLTYDIFSTGLTPDEVVGYLDKVVALG